MEMKTFLRANWDRAVAVVLVLAGVILLVVGWFEISGTGLVAEQLPYLISAGLGGVALITLGCTAWLSADLQDEWRRMDGIEARLRDLGRPEPPPASDFDVTTDVPVVAGAASSNGSGHKPGRRSTTRPATKTDPNQ